MNRPILLWMTSRSRSSMVSSIFAQHGVFWGNTQKQSAGYDTYENQNIKALQKKIFKSLRGLDPINDNDPVNEFIKELNKFVPQTRTWSMKTGVEFFNAFLPLNPYNIFITRKTEDVAQSLCNKRPGTDYDEALRVANWRFDYMRELQAEHDGVFVSTDKIIAEDFSEIKEAIEYCDLEYNEEAAKRAIKR